MGDDSFKGLPFSLEAGRRIMVLLPDDGTDRRLIRTLRRERAVTRADSTAVRAVAMLREAKVKSGRLPEPELARLVTVVVSETEADDLFDYVYEAAGIGRPGGGMLLMDRLIGATPYALPAELPDEQD